MKYFKIIQHVLILAVLATIAIGNGLFYWRTFTQPEKPVPAYIQINDSLRIVQAKREQFEDSAAFYTLKTKTLYAKKDSVDRLDSIHRVSLRDSYRTRIRREVAAGL